MTIGADGFIRNRDGDIVAFARDFMETPKMSMGSDVSTRDDDLYIRDRKGYIVGVRPIGYTPPVSTKIYDPMRRTKELMKILDRDCLEAPKNDDRR